MHTMLSALLLKLEQPHISDNISLLYLAHTCLIINISLLNVAGLTKSHYQTILPMYKIALSQGCFLLWPPHITRIVIPKQIPNPNAVKRKSRTSMEFFSAVCDIMFGSVG
ncbi:Os12g0223000 [Oryza sativa Japonica Group]|uniref:Os12g0223000 protein n=2 Tax=Oryza sativa subsp. japonica TaxID=39947 RepID=A0A0P0Y892_ORYSJ|nr:hypothetical protein EE612_058478 [Oryza sativa]BAF29439.1 Os12g0223000 [Oryza sativa Japonica Group]BAT16384.1 Os12g0223000 [Oryza sativa Japonica Group]|eukprot:NP_001066420.1 Os12g0223000 [Oryza sativa Japonica Group]